MEKQKIGFDYLVEDIEKYMKSNLEYSDSYIDRHKYGWRRIRFFLSINNYDNYRADLENDIIKYIFGDKNLRNFRDSEHLIHKSILQLSEYVKTGAITKKRGIISKEFSFQGDVGRVILNFSNFKKETFKTERRHFYCQVSLRQFYKFCIDKNVGLFQEIEMPLMMEYLSQIECHQYGNIRSDIPVLRQLMKFAFEEREIKKDFSQRIPVYKGIHKTILPSVYTIDEVNTLLQSFDRSKKIGKRNYAVAVLATHLGLRQSDIANLKFENIDWEKSKLNFVQMKTRHPQTLPLLSDVGNAIIDYIKYSRPSSNSPYVFLTCRCPAVPFGLSTASSIIQKAFKRAGIDISKRRFGAHSLRHSLADRLLKTKTIYPVITEVLGHKNTNSAMAYLSIDLEAMSICIEDVPEVPKEFYEQKGGVFYA